MGEVIFLLVVSLLIISSLEGTMVPFLPNVTFIPLNPINTTLVHNQTTQSCLCIAATNYIAFNWFPNGTCEFFSEFPITYLLKNETDVRVYFPQGIFPNESQCSMSNLTLLLEKLRNGFSTSVAAERTRNLVFDEDGYLLAIQKEPPKLKRLESESLTLVNQTNLNSAPVYSFAYREGVLYTPLMNYSVIAYESQTLKQLGNSTSIYSINSRSIIFIDQGNTMIVSAFGTKSILFLKRDSNLTYQYTFDYRIVVNYSQVHGLTYVDDNQFYATDYATSMIYSYSRSTNSSTWNQRLFIDARPIYNGSGATITIDPDGRLWYLLEGPTIMIFDQNGSFLDWFNISSSRLFAALFTKKYVLYLSDTKHLQNRIIRIDPDIGC